MSRVNQEVHVPTYFEFIIYQKHQGISAMKRAYKQTLCSHVLKVDKKLEPKRRVD